VKLNADWLSRFSVAIPYRESEFASPCGICVTFRLIGQSENRALHWSFFHAIVVLCGVPDVITHAKFYVNRLRGFSAASPPKVTYRCCCNDPYNSSALPCRL